MILERIAARGLFGFRRLLLESLPAEGLIGLHLPPGLFSDVLAFALFGRTAGQARPEPADVLREGSADGEIELDLDGLRLTRTIDRTGRCTAALVRLADGATLASGPVEVLRCLAQELGLDYHRLRGGVALSAELLQGHVDPCATIGLERLAAAAGRAEAEAEEAARRLAAIEQELACGREDLARLAGDPRARQACEERAAQLAKLEREIDSARASQAGLTDRAAAAEAVERALVRLEQHLLGGADDAALRPAQSRLLDRYAQLHALQRSKSRQIGEGVEQVEHNTAEADAFSLLRLELDKLRNMVAVRGRRISRAIDPNPQRDRARTDRQLLDDNLLLKIRASGLLEQRLRRGLWATATGSALCAAGAVVCLAWSIAAEGALRSTLLVSGFCLVLATGLLGWIAVALLRRQQATRASIGAMEQEAQQLDRHSRTCLHFNPDRLCSALTAAELLGDPEILGEATRIRERYPQAVELPSIAARHDELQAALRDSRSRLRQAEAERATIEQLMSRLESQLPRDARPGEAPEDGQHQATPPDLEQEVAAEIDEFLDAMRRRRILNRGTRPPLSHAWGELCAALEAFAKRCPGSSRCALDPELLAGLQAAEEEFDVPRATALLGELRKRIATALPALAASQQELAAAQQRIEECSSRRAALEQELLAQPDAGAAARALQGLEAERHAAVGRGAAARRAGELLRTAAEQLAEEMLPAVSSALERLLPALTGKQYTRVKLDNRRRLMLKPVDSRKHVPLDALPEPPRQHVRLGLLLLLAQAALPDAGDPRLLVCEACPDELLDLLESRRWPFRQALLVTERDLPGLSHVVRPEQDGEAVLWKGREDLWTPVG